MKNENNNKKYKCNSSLSQDWTVIQNKQHGKELPNKNKIHKHKQILSQN